MNTSVNKANLGKFEDDFLSDVLPAEIAIPPVPIAPIAPIAPITPIAPIDDFIDCVRGL